MNQELPDVQAGFRKGRGTRDQIANICWIIEKAREFQKKTAASLIMPKSLIVWITTNCGKFLKRWEYHTTWPVSWEICMQVKKQQLELDMEQQTSSSLKYICQGYIWSPCLFNLYAEYIMRNAGLDEHKMESRLPGEKSITSDMQMTPPLWQKVKKNERASWRKWKRRVEKVGLKLNIQKTKIMASSPITSRQIDGESVEAGWHYFGGAPKSLQMVTAAMKLKDAYSLEGKLWPT